MSKSLYRLAAFSDDPSGGNPAGVWVGEALPDPEAMQAIAAEVGYSETAFIAPSSGEVRSIRYFSPLAEVSFCGHATIASAVVLGRLNGVGTYQLDTSVGRVPVTVESVDGQMQAALTSVEPVQKPASAELVNNVLDLLNWSSDEWAVLWLLAPLWRLNERNPLISLRYASSVGASNRFRYSSGGMGR